MFCQGARCGLLHNVLAQRETSTGVGGGNIQNRFGALEVQSVPVAP